ncbi:hypothetical protein [Erythrobacter sp. YT30]|uniref:hypothetical protein n=1 Tax=Erythrobacter sp. YT30 TaxID=1735012 RepID=UPI00076CCCB1|nr:hypothetical protein [Erythrobacter sp. YT30]KWV90812.1 hypothetical protein AUC45_05540 [Erythrobacter sp. YT30]
MRPALVLGFLAVVFVARITFGDGPEGSFDDRFDRAEREMKNLSESIEAELAETNDEAADSD